MLDTEIESRFSVVDSQQACGASLCNSAKNQPSQPCNKTILSSELTIEAVAVEGLAKTPGRQMLEAGALRTNKTA